MNTWWVTAMWTSLFSEQLRYQYTQLMWSISDNFKRTHHLRLYDLDYFRFDDVIVTCLPLDLSILLNVIKSYTVALSNLFNVFGKSVNLWHWYVLISHYKHIPRHLDCFFYFLASEHAVYFFLPRFTLTRCPIRKTVYLKYACTVYIK